MRSVLRLAALGLPIVGICCMAMLAAFSGDVSSRGGSGLAGMTWRIPIAGYDPRDPILGHYVSFSFDVPVGAHGVCLAGDPQAPDISALSQGQACDGGRLPPDTATEAHRFYIPQAAGDALENLLRSRDHDAAIEVSATWSGGVQFGRLFIDGEVWVPGAPE